MPSNPDRRPRRQRPPSSGRPRNARNPRSARNAKQRSNSAVGSSLRGSSSQSLGSRKRSPTAREAIIIAALAAILILLLVLLINGIRGCVGRRDGAAPQQAQQQEQQAEQPQTTAPKPTVSSDVSKELQAELQAELDRYEKIATIAQEAGKYPEDLVRLALDEPAAIDFVLGYNGKQSSAEPFTDTVNQNTFPELYTFDARWGYTEFAGGLFAVTGSAPTAVSIAYMGLTGSNTKTPTVVGDMATADNNVTNGGVTSKFFSDTVNEIKGIACTELDPNEYGITGTLTGGGAAVIIGLPAGSSLGSSARYVVAIACTDDGSTTLVDPLSATNTSRRWPASSLAAEAQEMYSLVATSTPTD